MLVRVSYPKRMTLLCALIADKSPLPKNRRSQHGNTMVKIPFYPTYKCMAEFLVCKDPYILTHSYFTLAPEKQIYYRRILRIFSEISTGIFNSLKIFLLLPYIASCAKDASQLLNLMSQAPSRKKLHDKSRISVIAHYHRRWLRRLLLSSMWIAVVQ